jgi:cell division transport system permease protein
MVLALIVFNSLVVFQFITASAINSIENKIDITAYFKPTTSEDEILSIKSALGDLPQVKDIYYISRDQALSNFEAQHQNDQTIIQALNEIGTNPLEASLEIKAKNPSQYGEIASYLDNPSISQYIDTVSYAQNQSIIDRLIKIISTINQLGLIIIIVLALTATLVVFNTIRLAIYSNRDEISIMRVVGASNILTRGPYIIEGIIYGIISAIISIFLVWPLLYFISPYLNTFIPNLNIMSYFWGNFLILLSYQLIFGIILGAFSSFIAVQKYLKN